MKHSSLVIVCLLLGLCGVCRAGGYNHDYSQTWTSKMFLSKPDDSGIIVYTTGTGGKQKLDIPLGWGGTEYAALYEITVSGLQFIRKVKVNRFQLEIDVKAEVPYYIIPGK